VGNKEDTPWAMWPITKLLLKRDGTRAPTAIHGSSGLKYYLSEKAKVIVDCLEIQFLKIICVMKSMNGGWMLEFKLHSKT
jgi:hypothetical protein